ncbi:pleiotropic drug resistance protein 3-like [Mangifera indica]|uniref:pleiotropic drug resistance protein 3-like n=1 Tax=Mangifera indica TaxID=29780 RepID=UPI001CF98FE2|nr:pleiotropic drug resistance protein 3-like [Mangifera indica]XP_044477813.1 pleiotropic drug resistance protein 3-like [Mangifera indica]
MMMEVSKRKESGIVPDVDVDTFMKVLELDIFGDTIFGDTMVGDEMRRGICGGQKRRLSTGISLVAISDMTPEKSALVTSCTASVNNQFEMSHNNHMRTLLSVTLSKLLRYF